MHFYDTLLKSSWLSFFGHTVVVCGVVLAQSQLASRSSVLGDATVVERQAAIWTEVHTWIDSMMSVTDTSLL